MPLEDVWMMYTLPVQSSASTASSSTANWCERRPRFRPSVKENQVPWMKNMKSAFCGSTEAISFVFFFNLEAAVLCVRVPKGVSITFKPGCAFPSSRHVARMTMQDITRSTLLTWPETPILFAGVECSS